MRAVLAALPGLVGWATCGAMADGHAGLPMWYVGTGQKSIGDTYNRCSAAWGYRVDVFALHERLVDHCGACSPTGLAVLGGLMARGRERARR